MLEQLVVGEVNGGIPQFSDANLFLLNPQGILFGPRASWNIGGSFLGTTASRMRFGEAGSFEAVVAVNSFGGVAIRAGARSTLATLWQVNNASTAEFMVRFYQALSRPELTKAEALRDAQLALLQGENSFDAP